MSHHHVTVSWVLGDKPFTYDGYSRDHEWKMGTGLTMQASAAEQYRGNPGLPNPEEALVGALSSCHMLTFLAIAARKGIVVTSYRDAAQGVLEKNAQGLLAVTRVILRPHVHFVDAVAEDVLAELHHGAHRGCFIANSVLTEVVVEPVV